MICKASESQREWLAKVLEPEGGANLYRSLITPAAQWPRDWRLYDIALRLAVLYPLLFPALIWIATGSAVSLGGSGGAGAPATGFELFPAEDRWSPRLALICALVLVLLASKLEEWAKASPMVLLRKASGWLPLLAYAVAVAFAVAVAVAFAVAGAGALAFAVAVAVAGAVAFAVAYAVAVAVAYAVEGAFAGAVAFAVAIAVAVAVAVAMEKTVGRGRGTLAHLLFTVVMTGVIALTAFFLPWENARGEAGLIFLFLGVLPLLNAVFDYVSYFTTLTLIRLGFHKPQFGIVAGIGDLIAALILFALSGATMTMAVAGANILAGVPLFPLGAVLHDVAINPGDYWWLYAMLFSTAVPTLLHFSVACFSGSALFLPRWRAWCLARLNSKDDAETFWVVLGIAVLWWGSLLLPFVLLGGLAYGINQWVWDYLGAYLDLMSNLACWVHQGACVL